MQSDEEFLDEVKAFVGERLDDRSLTVHLLAMQMRMSRMHLHRRLRELTGQSASEFIRYTRLSSSIQLLKSNRSTITDIATAMGFGSLAYFGRCFRRQFGCTPSNFRKTNHA